MNCGRVNLGGSNGGLAALHRDHAFGNHSMDNTFFFPLQVWSARRLRSNRKQEGEKEAEPSRPVSSLLLWPKSSSTLTHGGDYSLANQRIWIKCQRRFVHTNRCTAPRVHLPSVALPLPG